MCRLQTVICTVACEWSEEETIDKDVRDIMRNYHHNDQHDAYSWRVRCFPLLSAARFSYFLFCAKQIYVLLNWISTLLGPPLGLASLQVHEAHAQGYYVPSMPGSKMVLTMPLVIEVIGRFRIREVQDSNFYSEIGYPNWGFSWFFSVPPSKCRGSTVIKLGHDRILPYPFQFFIY
jgi:hypothetical protein